MAKKRRAYQNIESFDATLDGTYYQCWRSEPPVANKIRPDMEGNENGMQSAYRIQSEGWKVCRQ